MATSARNGSYLLKWEHKLTKQNFPIAGSLPFNNSQRDYISSVLSFQQILDCNTHLEDPETRRKQKWKEILHFYKLSQLPEYKNCSIENALWSNSDNGLTVDHFIVQMTNEYKFDPSLKFYAHLRYMYWSCEGGTENKADWRDILALFQILTYFRLIKDTPIELILKLFDIYTLGDRYGKSVNKDEYVMPNPKLYVQRILLMTCLLDKQVSEMNTLMKPLILRLDDYGKSIKRRAFQQLISEQTFSRVVELWSKMGWERLSAEQRLTVIDEGQMFHRDNAERLLMRYKLTQALRIYSKNCLKIVVREWRLVTMRESGVRNYLVKKMYRKRQRYFMFLYSYTKHKWTCRRRRMLADAMGIYSMKARSFARIKLFNYNTVRLRMLVGSLDKEGKKHVLAGSHMREFRRLNTQKIAFHRWWYKIKDMINLELVIRHDFERLTRWVMTPWRVVAHEGALVKRAEAMVLANKQRFDAMMEEAEQTAKMLYQLEQEKLAKEKAEEETREAERKSRLLEEAKRRKIMEQMAEKTMILEIQRDERKRQTAKKMKKMKDDFNAEWDLKWIDLKLKAKNRITSYIENPNNKLAIEMRFERLKREFFQPPTPETVEREKMLTDPKNIAFLYVDAKLRASNIVIGDLVPTFDKKKKGYLTYTEFGDLLLSTGAQLNKSQLGAICRGVDKEKTQFITTVQIEDTLKVMSMMGVDGSPWKMYVDPADDVMCYHNFVTGVRVYEYKMTDKLLHEINITNIYGEEENKAVLEIREMKKADWKFRIETMMAKKLQFLYRLRKARKWRAKRIWKILNKQRQQETERNRKFVRKLEALYRAYMARQKFRTHLGFYFEKVWDVDSALLFWHNHKTKESTWTMPYLLKRYGDVEKPSPWLPKEVLINEDGTVVLSASDEEKQRRLKAQQELLQTTMVAASIENATTESDSRKQSDDSYEPPLFESVNRNRNTEFSLAAAAATEQSVDAADPTDTSTGDGMVVVPIPKEIDSAVTDDGEVSREHMYRLYYWHVPARRELHRKPDGYPLCGMCCRYLALRQCVQCDMHYCWSCHEQTHSCPLGVAQFAKATRLQLQNPIFLQRMNFFMYHTWMPSKPTKCVLCATGKANAGIHCNTCNTDMCRSCARRVHEHTSKFRHEFYDI